MSIVLNKEKFFLTLSAAVLSMAGSMFIKGGDQLDKFNGNSSLISTIVGIVLMSIGWIGIAYMTGLYQNNVMNEKSILCIVSSIIILGICITMTQLNKKYNITNPAPKAIYILPVVFSLAWITLGYGVGMHKEQLAMWFGIGAALCIMLSMLLLPWQRNKCLVNGPGMCLIAFAFGGLAIANSMGEQNSLSFY